MVFEVLRVERFDCARRLFVQCAAPLAQQRFVSDLLCQRVLEAVFDLAKRRLFIDKFAEPKMRQHLL
jgi:hypothetical protein